MSLMLEMIEIHSEVEKLKADEIDKEMNKVKKHGR